MTIRELKTLLDDFNDDNARVVFQPENSYYVEGFDICEADFKGISAFYGDDYKALVLGSLGQVGSV